jgi:hypothetical protein
MGGTRLATTLSVLAALLVALHAFPAVAHLQRWTSTRIEMPLRPSWAEGDHIWGLTVESAPSADDFGSGLSIERAVHFRKVPDCEEELLVVIGTALVASNGQPDGPRGTALALVTVVEQPLPPDGRADGDGALHRATPTPDTALRPRVTLKGAAVVPGGPITGVAQGGEFVSFVIPASFGRCWTTHSRH